MGTRLYVGNLPYAVTELDLRDLFGGIGTVTDAKIVTDRETGRPRGFGFVEMSTEDEARKAIEEVNGRDVQGRQVAVKEAEDRRGGSGGGGGGRASGAAAVAAATAAVAVAVAAVDAAAVAAAAAVAGNTRSPLEQISDSRTPRFARGGSWFPLPVRGGRIRVRALGRSTPRLSCRA